MNRGRVRVHDTHFDIVGGNGNVVATSRVFANKHSARRGAKDLIKMFRDADIVLEYVNEQSKNGGPRTEEVLYPAKPDVVQVDPRKL